MIVAETGVIVVTIQYRVSIFGFFYANDSEAPGNQGLLDQNLALKWVQDNIQNFGGDKTRVTIFGESAGGASASLHLLSPLSRDLFRNAIMQSGTSLASWSLVSQAEGVRRSTYFLQSIGSSGALKDQISCARRLSADTLIQNASSIFPVDSNDAVIFLPVVDGYFLRDTPKSLLSKGDVKKCPVLLGSNKNEGNLFFLTPKLVEYFDFSKKPTITYDKFQKYIKSTNTYYPSYPNNASEAVLNAILYRYTNWKNVDDTNANYDNLDASSGDNQIVCPTVDLATQYAKLNQDVYMYRFDQYDPILGLPKWFGATHAGELGYVFGVPLNENSNYSYPERLFTRKLLRYWTNFAKYNNPNDPRTSSCLGCVLSQVLTQLFEFNLEDWPKYQIVANSDKQRAFLIMSSDMLKVDYNLRADYCEFWNSYLPSIKSC
jgi:acetylcholinesterase